MKKLTLIVGILVGAVFLGIAINSIYKRNKTKALSPEAKARYEKDDLNVTVHYCRPYKKGRAIFGELVPYGDKWRTGANEATVLATNQEILVNGKKLRSGRHQLITIPYPDHWTIIINWDVPGWGINLETGKVYHNKKMDELVFDVPVIKQSSVTEQFTISFDEAEQNAELALRWDSVKVSFPVAAIKQ
jgi:hypothetical protein